MFFVENWHLFRRIAALGNFPQTVQPFWDFTLFNSQVIQVMIQLALRWNCPTPKQRSPSRSFKPYSWGQVRVNLPKFARFNRCIRFKTPKKNGIYINSKTPPKKKHVFFRFFFPQKKKRTNKNPPLLGISFGGTPVVSPPQCVGWLPPFLKALHPHHPAKPWCRRRHRVLLQKFMCF